MGEGNITKIVNALIGVKDHFNDNELAYLSLTSKNEGIIRDSFCRNYYKENSILGREYKRIDAVSFFNGNVQGIFEFTSMYTADLLNENHFRNSYLPKIIKDFNKNEKYKCKDTEEYIILISTHPKELINKKYSHYVKYLSGLNSATKTCLKNSSDSNEMIVESYKTLRKHFNENKYYINSCEINAGREFDCEVDIIFWILSKRYCCCNVEVANILTDKKVCKECEGFVKVGMMS